MENFSRPLVDWYKKEARPLPWREEPTPYRVWVSEIMLQQTRIEAAREYFNRFTRAFPTVEALAAAELDDVLKLWEGLGYYSRARNLHKCAKTVCETYGGVFPPDAAALRALPGIGDYTAGAIASIAYGLPEPAVDGNVLRVLARMECFGESIGSDKVKKRFREALREIYPAGECGAFTSALMELGETVCTVGTPSCARCPVAAYCAAHRCGEEALYPVLPEKKPRRIENRRVLLLLCGDTCAVQRRADTGLLASMWELPNDLLPDAPETGEPCGEAVHIFSHVEWHMRGYIVRCKEKLPGYVWVTRRAGPTKWAGRSSASCRTFSTLPASSLSTARSLSAWKRWRSAKRSWKSARTLSSPCPAASARWRRSSRSSRSHPLGGCRKRARFSMRKAIGNPRSSCCAARWKRALPAES